jgi:hypothetical protein
LKVNTMLAGTAFYALLLGALLRSPAPPNPYRSGTPRKVRSKPIGYRRARKLAARARALENFRRIERDGVPAKYLSAHARRRLAGAAA